MNISAFDFLEFESNSEFEECNCDSEKEFFDNKGLKCLQCLECGVIVEYSGEITTEKPFSIKTRNLGEKPKKVIAEKISEYIQNAKLKCSMSEMEKILNLCYSVYMNETKRADPRIGLFAASTMRVLGIEKNEAAKIFSVDVKYISNGINCLNKIVNNYPIFDLKEKSREHIDFFWSKISKSNAPIEILEIILIADAFQIGCSVPIKTRVLGCIWLYLSCKQLGISDSVYAEKIGFKKETYLKFYREFSIKFHIIGRKDGQYTENLKYRNNLLKTYFTKKNIEFPIINFHIKNSLNYKNFYIFDPSI